MMVLEACKRRDAGQPVDAIADYLEKIRERLVIVCCMNTLEYLHKGGRLPATVSIIGGMLNIKPVVLIKDGKISILHTARGMKAAAKWMVDYVAEQGFDASLPIGFIHSDNPEGAVEVRKMLAEKCSWGEEIVQGIGPVIGTHIGDGCVAIACFWKEKITPIAQKIWPPALFLKASGGLLFSQSKEVSLWVICAVSRASGQTLKPI